MKKRKKILVVDDDPVIVRLLNKLLLNDGYEFVAAYDGLSGVQMATEENPDLILLDVIMPDLRGPDVVRALKENKKTKDIPIVFMTTMISLKADRGSEVINVDEVEYRAFAKPLHHRKILSVIRKAINRRSHNNS